VSATRAAPAAGTAGAGADDGTCTDVGAGAGEAGRGFAVVASEVRSLAQRSSQAAKDIKDLITNSSSQVQEGVVLVNRAGASLTEIVASIKRVAEIVSDITTASGDQSSGIDQVNTALTQMDQVTQQTSALVEQHAAAAKALEQQSHTMHQRVSFFRVGNAQPTQVPTERVVASIKRAAPEAAKPQSTPAKQGAHRRSIVGRMQTALAGAVKPGEGRKKF